MNETKLGNILKNIKDKYDPTKEAKYDIPYIGLENIEKGKGIISIGKADDVKSIKTKFKKGDLLYGKLRPYLDKHDIADFDGICSTDILVYRAENNVTAKWVNYFMSTTCFIDYAIENSNGINLPRTSDKAISLCSIPLPPLETQKRIVNRIESLFAKLDEAKEKAQTALDTFELRKSAILHKAFTGELTAQWREENRAVAVTSENSDNLTSAPTERPNNITSVSTEHLHNISSVPSSLSMNEADSDSVEGSLPNSWRRLKLGDLLLPMKTKKPEGNTFRYIDIDSIDNINQKVKEPKTLKTSDAPSRASRAVEKGNILFSMVRPYLKNIALIDSSLSDCIASTGFYVCRCHDKLFANFLYHLLCSKDSIDYLMQFMKGDNSPSIRKDDLLNMHISLPPLPEQQEIVRILDDLLAKENAAKEAAEAVIEKIDLMKKSILARAFRGEL